MTPTITRSEIQTGFILARCSSFPRRRPEPPPYPSPEAGSNEPNFAAVRGEAKAAALDRSIARAALLPNAVSHNQFLYTQGTAGTVSVDGTQTPEALVFDLDGDGRIAHISIYIQRPEFAPAEEAS